jgi:metallophosphoesterase superfamily enzyme
VKEIHLADLDLEYIKTLVAQSGGCAQAADYILSVFSITDRSLDRESLRKYLSRILNKEKKITDRADPDRISRIEKLLDNANIPLESLGRIENVKLGIWGVHAKDKDGNIQTSYLDKTQISLIPEAPPFPVVNCAEPKTIQFSPKVVRTLKKTWQAVVVSDTQIGFLQDPETKETSPIHDPQAMAIAKRITLDVAPKELYFIGDWMDWPFLSRWQQHDEFDAVNESIQEGYIQLCEFISAAGPQVTKKIMIGGNHDIRPEKFLLEHNRKAMRIRRAGDTWPVFSQQFLLRYDELGIDMPGYYPSGEYYVLSDLLLTHAPPKAAEFQASVIHGHQHKLSITPRVQHTESGRKVYLTYDIGCLCRVDSTTNPYRLLRTSVPSDQPRTNWQQGLGVVNVVDGKFPVHSVDLIHIQNGKAIYGGKPYGFDE